MASLSVGGIHPTGKAVGGIQFQLDGALAAHRNFGALAEFFPTMVPRAMGTLARRLYTEARRDIVQEYAIQQSRVAKDLRTRALPGAVTVTGYFRGIGLRNFSARQTARGVTAGVFRGKARRLRASAFLIDLKRGTDEGGNLHVAKRGSPKRVMTAGRYKGRLRDPLVTQYGPTVAQMLRKEGRPQRLATFAVGVLGAEATRLIESHLRRSAAPAA